MSKKLTTSLRNSIQAEKHKVNQTEPEAAASKPAVKQPAAQPTMRQAQPKPAATAKATTVKAKPAVTKAAAASKTETPKIEPTVTSANSTTTKVVGSQWQTSLQRLQTVVANYNNLNYQLTNSVLASLIGVNDDLNWFIKQVSQSKDFVGFAQAQAELFTTLSKRQRELFTTSSQLLTSVASTAGKLID